MRGTEGEIGEVLGLPNKRGGIGIGAVSGSTFNTFT